MYSNTLDLGNLREYIPYTIYNMENNNPLHEESSGTLSNPLAGEQSTEDGSIDHVDLILQTPKHLDTGQYLLSVGDTLSSHTLFRIRQRPDLLTQEWDTLIDESIETLRENPVAEAMGETLTTPLYESSFEGEICYNELLQFDSHNNSKTIEIMLLQDAGGINPYGRVTDRSKLKLLDSYISKLNSENDGCLEISYSKNSIKNLGGDLKSRFVLLVQDFHNISRFGLKSFQFVNPIFEHPTLNLDIVKDNSTHMKLAVSSSHQIPEHIFLGTAAYTSEKGTEHVVSWAENAYRSGGQRSSIVSWAEMHLKLDHRGHVTVLKARENLGQININQENRLDNCYPNCTLVAIDASDYTNYALNNGGYHNFSDSPSVIIDGVETNTWNMYQKAKIKWNDFNPQSNYEVEIQSLSGELLHILTEIDSKDQGVFWTPTNINPQTIRINVLENSSLVHSSIVDLNGDGALDVVVAVDQISGGPQTGKEIKIPAKTVVSNNDFDGESVSTLIELRFYNESSDNYVSIGLEQDIQFNKQFNISFPTTLLYNVQSFDYFDVKVSIVDYDQINGISAKIKGNTIITLRGTLPNFNRGTDSLEDNVPFSNIALLLFIISIPVINRFRKQKK